MHDRTVLRAAFLHAVGCGLSLTAAASAAGCFPCITMHHQPSGSFYWR